MKDIDGLLRKILDGCKFRQSWQSTCVLSRFIVWMLLHNDMSEQAFVIIKLQITNLPSKFEMTTKPFKMIVCKHANTDACIDSSSLVDEFDPSPRVRCTSWCKLRMLSSGQGVRSLRWAKLHYQHLCFSRLSICPSKLCASEAAFRAPRSSSRSSCQEGLKWQFQASVALSLSLSLTTARTYMH